MALAHSQTVEDGAPREEPSKTRHNEGSDTEFMRVEMKIRRWLGAPTVKLVIHASRISGRVTASLEGIT